MGSKTFKDLFRDMDKHFEIPSYQRAYSWDEENVKRFIEDLKEEGSKYYFGNFIFNCNEDESTYYIIDGQQRITTCMIFFSVLKDFLKDKTEDINKYLYNKNGDSKFKIVEYDNNYFRKEILNLPIKYSSKEFKTLSKKRIKEARDIIKKELSKKNVGNNMIEKWLAKIENAKITWDVENDKILSAQIFSFQNDRGKILTNLEKIKSYFILQFYLDKNHNQNTMDIENSFADIYGIMEQIKYVGEDDILHYWWLGEYKEGFKSYDILQEIKESILEENDKIELIKRYARELAKAFETVKKIQSRKDEDTKNLLLLDNMALSYPFFIKVDRSTDDDRYLDVYIKALENITFRSLVKQAKAKVEHHLNDIFKSISSENLKDSSIQIVEWTLSDKSYWNDWYLQDKFNSTNFYDNHACKYLLYRYDKSIGNDTPYDRTEIEHIAPQTPTDGSTGYGRYNTKKGIEGSGFINSLGNLMITTMEINRKCSNKSFNEKLEIYNCKQQVDDIKSCLANKSNLFWDLEAIQKRQEKIVNAIMDIWDLNKVVDFINEKIK